MHRRELARTLIAAAAASSSSPWQRDRSPAESDARVVPSNTSYPPGDLRRYGAMPASNITDALSAAVAQAQQPGGSPVYLPAALGAHCFVSAGVTVTTPITIYGDNRYQSVISTPNDITIFTVSGAQSQGVLIRDLQLRGPGAGAVRPGVLFIGTPYNALERIRIKGFGIGVQFATGGYSCFLNRLLGSEIIQNNLINIDAQSQTHQLSLHQVTFGSAPTGLHLVDSSGLSVFGGDCEGCTSVCIDLDNETTRNGNHYLCGLDLEGNQCRHGNVRIGKTAVVDGVTLINFGLSPGHGDQWFVNPLRCGGLTVTGCTIWGGYASGTWINRAGEVSNLVCSGNGPRADLSGQPRGPAADSFWSPVGHPQAFRVPTAFDAHYQDGASYNQYAADASDLDVPGGHWYAGLDVMHVHAGAASAASGVKAYARAMIARSERHGELKCGAALMRGDVDIEGPIGVMGQATTGRRTAVFSATNKPGDEMSSPSKWLPVTLDGATYYIPCWR